MTVILSYDPKASAFVEGNKSNALAQIEISPDGKAQLTFSPEAGLIARRTASRQAESVSKSGFLLASGERVGLGSTLEIIEPDKLSEAHLREGYKYNKY